MMANELDAGGDEGQRIMTLPEVPDDGVLIKTLYAGVCHATHSSQEKLDLTSFVGQLIMLSSSN